MPDPATAPTKGTVESLFGPVLPRNPSGDLLRCSIPFPHRRRHRGSLGGRNFCGSCRRADALFCIPLLKGKTPEERAHADLETHYTKEYLDEKFESCTRRAILYKEYVKNISSSGMQSSCGFEGQINSCWTHKMTTKEQNEEATVLRRMMMFLVRKRLKAAE